VIVKLKVFATLGVPVIAPVLPSRLRSSGRLPAVTKYVLAPVPPLVWIVWL
jgi:hypothetical protein